MKNYVLALFILIISSACGKIENSNSLDEILYGVFVDTGSPQFLTSKAIINSHCLQCHAAWKRYSEQDFIDGNLIIKGDSANSKLYNRNLFAQGPGQHNMPTSGLPPISTGDLALISTWIMTP